MAPLSSLFLPSLPKKKEDRERGKKKKRERRKSAVTISLVDPFLPKREGGGENEGEKRKGNET